MLSQLRRRKPFRFLALPFEIREMIYTLAAASYDGHIPLRARTVKKYRRPRQQHSQFERELDIRVDDLPSVHIANKHTLHNLMRVSKTLYAEVKTALQRHVQTSPGQALRHI